MADVQIETESPDCEYDTAIQTIEHIIMNCPNTNNQRETTYNQMDDIYAMRYLPVWGRNLDLNTIMAMPLITLIAGLYMWTTPASLYNP